MSGRAGFGAGEERGGGLLVRWGLVEDEPGISALLELNGLPRTWAFEERFIVVEERGMVLAALQYRTYSKRLLLELLVADPWTEEHPLAVALYAGAGELAREIGVTEVLARPVPHADYPQEAGYHRRGRRWRLDTTQPPGDLHGLPASGWQRTAALLGILTVPFHRTFHD